MFIIDDIEIVFLNKLVINGFIYIEFVWIGFFDSYVIDRFEF